ncbi:MAG: type II secretion system F family protein [Clostridia bacterium]|nr:type II secretion system F family protein [Clostridia bacterium]
MLRKKTFVGRIPDEALYAYFLSVRVHLSLGKNVTTALFDNIKYVKNLKLRKLLSEIRSDMFMNGTSFSDAFKAHERAFPSEVVPLLCMGEATGTMDVSVKSCESLLRMRVETEKAIKNEMTYPFLVVLLIIVLSMLLVIFVLPSFLSLLPDGLPTEVNSFAWNVLLGVAIFSVLFLIVKLLCRTVEPIGKFFHMLKLYFPVFGNVERAKVTAMCSLCLDIMMKSGMSGMMIYDMLMKVVPNKHVKANLEDSYESLLDGVSIDVCIRTTKGFTDFFYSIPIMTKVLDEKGMSPLEICAERAVKEMEAYLKKIVSFIQPALFLVIGFVVIGLFAAIFTPYLNSMQDILDML